MQRHRQPLGEKKKGGLFLEIKEGGGGGGLGAETKTCTDQHRWAEEGDLRRDATDNAGARTGARQRTHLIGAHGGGGSSEEAILRGKDGPGKREHLVGLVDADPVVCDRHRPCVVVERQGEPGSQSRELL